MSATKQIFTHDGRFVPEFDAWYCPDVDCDFVWGGKDRAPPHPFCPKCDHPHLRRCKA